MKYLIEQTQSGVILGIYDAETPEEAWADCAQDAGHDPKNKHPEILISEALTGIDAIEIAERNGTLKLCKYADPIEGAIDDIDADTAREVAAEDASLIYLANNV